MIYYFIIRNFKSVFVLFMYLTSLAVRALFALQQNNISKFGKVRTYYVTKLLVIVFWVLGFYTLAFFSWYYNIDQGTILGNAVPVAIGIVIDLYFCYALYSCYALGIKGELIQYPHVGVNPSQDFIIVRADPNQNISGIAAESCEEIMAYPELNIHKMDPAENGLTILKDFTMDMYEHKAS